MNNSISGKSLHALSPLCLGGLRDGEYLGSGDNRDLEGYKRIEITPDHAVMLHDSFSPVVEDRRAAALNMLFAGYGDNS